MTEYDFAKNVAIDAGSLLLKKFNHLSIKDISFKDRYEIVTKLDYESEKIILNAIKKKFPDHSIVSEEAGFIKNKSDYLWIIDPLDGSTNYKIGSPLFAVIVTLAYKGKIQFGFSYAPALGEFYEATLGHGAKLNNRKLHVSKTDKLVESINLYCHGNTKKDVERAVKIYDKLKLAGRDCRQIGCAALEFGFVAAGRTESILIPGANLWDAAAGALMVKEAGGCVTDFEGTDWTIDSKNIIASNGLIHKDLLKQIASSQITNLTNNESNEKLIYPELSYKIVGTLFDVYNELGYGLRERNYQEAIRGCLKSKNISFKEQLKSNIYMKDRIIKKCFLDFLIDDKIVLEIKSQDRFNKENVAQVYDYLKSNNIKLGILANFSKNGLIFKRIIYKN
jgi:myo-inositol-1(or 4)-monophosphatase